MAITGDTQLGPTKMELISEIAQRALISESRLLATARDVSAFAGKGNSTISFPKNSTLFTVENRASAAAGTTQDVDFLKDTLALNQRAHIQWLIDSEDEIESRLDVMREYITRAAAEHGADVDRKIIAELEAVGITTTTAGDISQDVVLEMREVLLRNKANPRNLFLAVGPDQEAKLLGIDPFVSADKYGSSAIPSGVLGTIYGVNIVMTPEIASSTYYMYESEGLAIGFQRRPTFAEDDRPEYGPGAKLQVLAQKYGVKGLQVDVPNAFLADGTSPLAGQSALIVKDAN
jgi:hypothetical protein